MPFAQIHMIEGRTEEQKKAVIEKVYAATGLSDFDDMEAVEFDEARPDEEAGTSNL